MNMKKKFRGLLCLWLVVLLVAALPLQASADTYFYVYFYKDSDQNEWREGEYFSTSTVPSAESLDLTKDGSTFKNWIVDSSYNLTGLKGSYSAGESFSGISQEDEYSSGGVLYLIGNWEKDSETYTVTFHANGGTGSMSSQTFTEGKAQYLSSNAFKRDGYTFTGWNTVSTGGGTSYGNGQSATFSENTDLYAQWKENTNDNEDPKPDPNPKPNPNPRPNPAPQPAYRPATVRPNNGGQNKPVSQTYIVSTSGDEKSTQAEATLSNKVAEIDKIDNEKLDTIIDINVKTGCVKFDFTSIDQELDAVSIPTESLKRIAEAAMDPENDTEGIEILFIEGMSITLDAEALNAITEQAKGNHVAFTFKKTEEKDLTAQQKKTLVGETAYEISITSDEEEISEFGGNMTIQVPYALGKDEKAEGISVFYVDEEGNQETFEPSYDSESKSVSWITGHLSVYMVHYKNPAIYTVQKGDTLYSIAQKAGCTVADIMELNRSRLGYNSTLIYEGWELTLPYA